MIVIQPRSRMGNCFACGNQGGRAPGISGLRGLGKGALGVLGMLGDGPSETMIQDGLPMGPALTPSEAIEVRRIATTTLVVGTSVMALGAGIAGYHGYKRSGGSIGSMLGWGLLGGIVPIITVPVALAQGYAKRR